MDPVVPVPEISPPLSGREDAVALSPFLSRDTIDSDNSGFGTWHLCKDLFPTSETTDL